MCFVLVVGLFLAGCGGGGGTTGAPSGGGGGGGGGGGAYTVKGRVIDASQPTKGIAGARITLYRSRTRQVEGQTTTDQNGYYSLSADQGLYTLRVELPDGTYQAVEIELVVNGNVTMNIKLVPREIQIARVTIVVPPGDGPNGSYLVGKTYKFKAKAYDAAGNEITTPLVPNWQVSGGIGTITEDGTFTATSPGTGKIKAIFTATKYFEATITVSAPTGSPNPPKKPSLIAPSDQQVVTSKPEFKFSASDPDGDRLRYKIEILKNGTPFQTYDQTQDVTGWSKPDYSSGETASFVPPKALIADTYQWLVYAFDGYNWSPPSDIRTFIVNNPPSNLKMVSPDDNASVSKTPVFKVSATDIDGDRIRYKLEILKDGSVIRTYDGSQSQNGWDQRDYASGEVATLTISDPLAIGTYQWRFYAYDGRSWSSASSLRTFVIPPTAIVTCNKQQSQPLIDLLIANGYNVDIRTDIPSDMGDADVLVIDETANIGTSDASKVQQLFDQGKNLVLIGQAPVKLALGQVLKPGETADTTSIMGWFGGVKEMKRKGYNNDDFYVRDPVLFSLPPGIKPDSKIYNTYGTNEYPIYVSAPGAMCYKVIDAHVIYPDRIDIFAFAYRSAEKGSRVYWQWSYQSMNAQYDKVDDLFIAAVNWAATGSSTKAVLKRGKIVSVRRAR
jgi:hypothetical protein